MRYMYACFKGYIGFYNGMGLEKLEIDFSKCKNKMILICGRNGSGKSTLMNAIDLFPDPSYTFVPNMDGEKILTLVNEKDIYEINIFSPSDSKGGRKTTKAFIKKNGLELNENGNVTSYKDIIFSEFELDSNYTSLSILSTTDRGIGDKTPALRKKYVGNTISNLEVYNQMYKTLNKKSLIYKSHTNTLSAKLQSIGIKDNIEMNLKSLRLKENDLKSRINLLNNSIISIEAKSSIDEDDANRIKLLTENLAEVSAKLTNIKSSMDIYVNKLHIKTDEIEHKYSEDKDLLTNYKETLSGINSQWIDNSNRLNNINSSINTFEANLNSSSSSIDNTLEAKYKKSNDELDNIRGKLKSLNIKDDTNLIIILANLLRFYEKFIASIDTFYDNIDCEQLNYIINQYTENDINKLQSELSMVLSSMEAIKNEVSDIGSKLKILSVLDNRPNKCNIDACPFIAESVKLKNQLGNTDLCDELSKLQKEQFELSNKCSEIQNRIDFCVSVAPKVTKFGALLEMIQDNAEALALVNDTDLLNIDTFKSNILNSFAFNNQRDPRRIIESLNLLHSLESELKINDILSVEYKNYREKIQMINSTKNMISKMELEKKDVLDNISKLKSEKDGYETLISSLSTKIQSELEFISVYNTYKDLESKKRELDIEMNEFNRKSTKALESVGLIQEYKNQMCQLDLELKPISLEINNCVTQLGLLNEYYTEYNKYKSSYDMIELLKKYCSPTAGGIQTLFMELYMKKTLDLSNQVLSLLFGGEYRLLDFVINSEEFRIPFIGNGLPVDDISSGSTSQICIMSMIINLVLMHQASTKFNIARLDEVDGGLDNKNRIYFAPALYKAMDILGIEQLFNISHSIETDSSAVDIIKLKGYEDYDDSITGGNIIYDYSKEIAKH